ncbi:MAG TPA: sel1 repeat family protein, partial [Candidatus Faecivivens stercorigallinarum]|nr:sel1 repeat family protein [Candidatus Faecivivens stercorigallinarum]
MSLSGSGAVLIGIFLAYRSLRDALYPEKSALAQSIRDQLRYPDETPPVKELFAMVDQDLKQNGQWCGKMGIGKEWVLGDVVSAISRIRGVFSRVERHTHHAGQRTQVTYTYEIWIVDDRQQRQVTSFKSEKQLEEAIDCLRHRAPAAVFGRYDSKEYNANFYREGKQGLISPQPEKAIEVYRYGAEKGYPSYFFYYANELYDQGKKEDAFDLYRRAAELGEPRAFFWVGYSYELGVGVSKDFARAAQYYQQALSAPIEAKVNPANRLGMFYYDGRGIEQDYAKSFQLLKWAEDNGGPVMLYYLGACYANGQGTQQDYAKALGYLERIDWNCREAFYLLGKLYCNGLGVTENIPKGVEYLQKAGEYAPAKEELKHYKKT